MIEFLPGKKGELLSYTAVVGGEELAAGYFYIDGFTVTVCAVEYTQQGDFCIEGLVRSILGYSANRRCYVAEMPVSAADEIIINVLDRLGFIIENENYTAEIPEVLSGSCCHKGENLCSEV